ncbi:GTP 3',8-cyclase MoaA [Clostridium sp.]|uniref:GTP 3',8-cyclase MoaA n=1 Tax=Clostridium sp. TaxID=1506 RepID=UPI003463C7B8
MRDKWGREINYLRISVTDRCNLRCRYCMPEGNGQYVENHNLLTNEEFIRLCRILTDLGVKKIRMTGGEPLVRKNINELIEGIGSIEGVEELCLTTNGILLYEHLDDFKAMGVTGINISLDSLNENTYRDITKGDLNKVVKAIKRSLSLGIKTKINSVIMKGVNYDEIMDLALLTEEYNLDVRFIELMPIGEGKKFNGVSSDELKRIIGVSREYEELTQGDKIKGPAEYIRIKGAKGKIGFISAMSHNFCSNCNRIRLTSEGFLKLCLHWNEGKDMGELLRRGYSDDEIKNILVSVINDKPKRHEFLSKQQGDLRYMFQIGG